MIAEAHLVQQKGPPPLDLMSKNRPNPDCAKEPRPK